MHDPPRCLAQPMYYDRQIDEALARTIGPGGKLYWLTDHVRSGDGADRRAHIQFRRNRRDRRLGSIQLYWGRTSPLEFKLRAGSQIRLNADPTYKAESPHLFSRRTVPIDRLGVRSKTNCVLTSCKSGTFSTARRSGAKPSSHMRRFATRD